MKVESKVESVSAECQPVAGEPARGARRELFLIGNGLDGQYVTGRWEEVFVWSEFREEEDDAGPEFVFGGIDHWDSVVG